MQLMLMSRANPGRGSSIAPQMEITSAVLRCTEIDGRNIGLAMPSSGGDKDFYQLLEVPHLNALSPGYKRLA